MTTTEASDGSPAVTWVSVLPHRWVAHCGETVAGSIDLTSSGRYRVRDGQGRNIGVFTSLDNARAALGRGSSTSLSGRIGSSRVVSIIGVVCFLAALAGGGYAIALLLMQR